MAGKLKIRIIVEGSEEVLAALERMTEDVQKELRTAALLGAEVIHDAAEDLAPGPNIIVNVFERPGIVTTEIRPDKEHWFYRFFELGATSHEIAAQYGGRMAFEAGGESVVVSSVQHPGMAAKPFLRPAFDENSERAQKAVEDYLRGVIEK